MCFYVNNYAIVLYSEQLILYRHSHILVEFVTYLVTVKMNAFIIIKYHIFSYFIIYIYTVKQSLCINILNSQNMLGNIFANEQFHRKLMFSGDIELNPGSVFL
jgi:hypothetical protein